MSNWNGLVCIHEIKHLNHENKVLWEDRNLKNVLHTGGEQLLLKALFVGGKTDNEFIPQNYLFGLDSRSSIAIGQTMANLVNEPNSNGYVRQSVSSSGSFVFSSITGKQQVNSPLLTFVASGGPWGPVNNLFMTNQIGNGGILISTVPLSAPLTVNAGERIILRMGLMLRDVPPEEEV